MVSWRVQWRCQRSDRSPLTGTGKGRALDWWWGSGEGRRWLWSSRGERWWTGLWKKREQKGWNWEKQRDVSGRDRRSGMARYKAALCWVLGSQPASTGSWDTESLQGPFFLKKKKKNTSLSHPRQKAVALLGPPQRLGWESEKQLRQFRSLLSHHSPHCLENNEIFKWDSREEMQEHGLTKGAQCSGSVISLLISSLRAWQITASLSVSVFFKWSCHCPLASGALPKWRRQPLGGIAGSALLLLCPWRMDSSAAGI